MKRQLLYEEDLKEADLLEIRGGGLNAEKRSVKIVSRRTKERKTNGYCEKKTGYLMKDCKGIWGRKNDLLIKWGCCRRFGARF